MMGIVPNALLFGVAAIATCFLVPAAFAAGASVLVKAGAVVAVIATIIAGRSAWKAIKRSRLAYKLGH